MYSCLLCSEPKPAADDAGEEVEEIPGEGVEEEEFYNDFEDEEEQDIQYESKEQQFNFKEFIGR